MTVEPLTKDEIEAYRKRVTGETPFPGTRPPGVPQQEIDKLHHWHARMLATIDSLAEAARVPQFTAGQIVRVDHPRYHGEGMVVNEGNFCGRCIANFGDERGWLVAVKLENNNVWWYEANTVTPAGGGS